VVLFSAEAEEQGLVDGALRLRFILRQKALVVLFSAEAEEKSVGAGLRDGVNG
jgi:hypothetical protein